MGIYILFSHFIIIIRKKLNYFITRMFHLNIIIVFGCLEKNEIHASYVFIKLQEERRASMSKYASQHPPISSGAAAAASIGKNILSSKFHH